MPISRADVDRLADLQRESVALAVADLQMVFDSVDLSKPEQVRDALLETVPPLVREYGEVAATAAAEWYEEVRGREVGGRFSARLGDLSDEAAMEGTVRWSARHLWEEGAAGAALRELSGAMQRHVTYAGRQTVARNVSLDRRRPRFARVPAGNETCGFCGIMSSRGFVYHTAASAGEQNDYHDNCDCQIVPQWDSESSHIEGYDPDDLFEKYEAARAAAGDLQASELAGVMRDMFPDQFTH